MPEIHAHTVMDLMQQSGHLFTRDSLVALLAERFGPEARFHTCSAAGMTADELIEFLNLRGKLAGDESGFTVSPHRSCGH
jgi:probable metal-binding protein